MPDTAIDMKSIGLEFGKGLLIAVAVLGVVWTVGKPHAENLITSTVKGQGYAKEEQFKRLDKKADKAIATTAENRDRGIRMETRQENILQLLQELRQQQRRIRN